MSDYQMGVAGVIAVVIIVGFTILSIVGPKLATAFTFMP